MKTEKPKRKKPFAATNATIKDLEAKGWTCWTVESHIPHTFIKRDCFGFSDILAMSPTRGIMLVQATGDTHGTGNMNKRVEKIKAEPRHALWLASGGRIQVYSWEKRKGQTERVANIMEIQKEEPKEQFKPVEQDARRCYICRARTWKKDICETCLPPEL